MSRRKNRNLPFPAQGTRLVETIFDKLQFSFSIFALLLSVRNAMPTVFSSSGPYCLKA